MVGAASGPDDLLESLGSSLPELLADHDAAGRAGCEVERRRSMGDRMAGRPGRVAAVTVNGPKLVLRLTGTESGRLEASAAQEVRGVVISRRTVPIAEWLDLLAAELRTLAQAQAVDDGAVARTLAALGIATPADQVLVPPGDVDDGLRRLPARLAGRVPDDVRAVVERLSGLLLDLLPRVAASSPQERLTVERTATAYLPDTLRAYLDLPRDWAETRPGPDGRTALDTLREQLTLLEEAVTRMRDAALSADADALRVNGLFLADRFRTSSLD